ncbi:MAG TPA: hypothetical protein VFM18_05760 [Methanosarcina sp.]|nr:hypothetical protein [Methanosarcina sp.]
MASSKTLIKNGITDVVYRFVNDSATNQTFTIALATDIARADQTIVGTPTVGISCLSFCTTAAIKITRNSNLQYYLVNTGEIQNAYATDNQDNTSDIVIDIASGTLEIRLLKGTQYQPI